MNGGLYQRALDRADLYTQAELRDLAERVYVAFMNADPDGATSNESMATAAIAAAKDFITAWQEHCKSLEVKP